MGSEIDVAPLYDVASGEILAIVSDRLQQLAVNNLGPLAQYLIGLQEFENLPDQVQPSATIALTLTTNVTQPSVTVRPAGPGTAGNPSQSVTQPPKQQTVTTITLDVVPTANGFAQSIVSTRSAQQQSHKTVGGFTIDEWGFAPGEITIEALVAYRGNARASLQAFTDLLYKAKATDPLSMDPALSLLYTNAVDGDSLLLSQASLDIKQSATDPNLARVTIHGLILRDYNAPAPASIATTPPTGASNGALSGQGAATSPQGELLSYTIEGTTVALTG